MTIDIAKQRFDDLYPEWNAVREKIETEQDTRFQLIELPRVCRRLHFLRMADFL